MRIRWDQEQEWGLSAVDRCAGVGARPDAGARGWGMLFQGYEGWNGGVDLTGGHGALDALMK